MERYAQYKDSTIPWLGEIPGHWRIQRGKTVLQLLNRSVKEDDDIITCFRDGEVTLRKNRREDGFTVSMKEIGYQGIEPGDLVVHGMDGFAGSIGVSDSRGKATPVLNVMDSEENKRYLMYYLRTAAYKDVFMSLSTGIRVRSCDLRWNKLSIFPFILPEKYEQDAIVDYIDTTLKKIDSVIAEAKASIEEYKQWKASIIYEAVTKGLDPNAKMKDSGVDWIGEIPASWHFIKITRVLDWNHPYPIGDGDHGLVKSEDYVDSGIPYIRVQNLGWGTPLSLDNVVYISETMNESIKNSTLQPNDILFAKTGATIGKTAIVPESLAIANTTSHVGKITVSKKYNARYIFYVLSSLIGFNQFWAIAAAKTTRPELAIDEIKSLKITMPSSYDEQQRIVEYLDSRIPSIEKLITEKESLIVDLEAYKKSLIFEVVTGKRKVV